MIDYSHISRVNQTEAFPLLLLSDVDIINMSIHQDTATPEESPVQTCSSRSAWLHAWLRLSSS